MSDRRYSDDEVAAIFAKAAEGPQAPPVQQSHENGLTLVDLQQIGREVGIAPEAVAQAARSMDVRPVAASQTFLGMPLGVGRTIELGRRLTDAEWEELVVKLRETFNARGTMSSSGSFRQWTNGNLQALLEPTATGHRLRLRTINGSARGMMTAGMAAVGMSGAVSVAGAVAGHLSGATPGIVLMLLIGLGMIGNSVLRLPGWARLRGRQMDAIAEDLALATGAAADEAKRLPGE